MGKSILVCDDDKAIRELVQEFLSQNHYQVDTVQDGTELITTLQKKSYNLILLDIMLPGDDGLTLCQKIRALSDIPIIMITAVDNDIDRVAALEFGADYYMTKPLNVRVLMAYIKTILRRHNKTSHQESVENISVSSEVYIFEGWQLNLNQRSLIAPNGIRVTLSHAEFQILLAFVRHPRCVLSRESLLDSALHRPEDPYDRSIDVLVSRLRRKIKAQADTFDHIETIRGVGYILDCEVTKSHA